MKKVIILVLVIALTLTAFAGCGNTNPPESGKVYPQDPFTSASVPQPKYDLGVTLDELTTLPSKGFPGTYLIATTNPNATANVGYVIYGVTKVGDKFYVVQGTGNQTGVNLLREKGGVAVWVDQFNSEKSIKVDGKGKNYTSRGAKMTLVLNTDKAVADALKLKEGSNAYEIVSFLQIG